MSKIGNLKKKVKRTGLDILVLRKKIKGYTVKNAKLWTKSVYRDLRRNKTKSLSQKRWAYKRGFMPNYVENHGITEENYKNYISERDYRYVASINGTYAKWLVDDVTAHKVLRKYAHLLPESYYNFYMRGTQLAIKKMEELPEGYEETLADVFRLIREKGEVVLRSSRYDRRFEKKIRYDAETDTYFYRGAARTQEEMAEMIENRCQRGMMLVLIEAVGIHPDFKVEHSGKSMVLKLVVINETGTKGEVTEAHLVVDGGRYILDEQGEVVIVNDDEDDSEGYDEDDSTEQDEVSTKKADEEGEDAESGVSGEEADETPQERRKLCRILCEVNLETGAFDGGQALLAGKIKKFEENPRSGKRIVGAIPGWEDIKKAVDELCCYIPQIEYMGLDIVIAKDGFKIIRFEDMPPFSRAYLFNEKTQRFLKLKLAEKQAECLSGKTQRAEFKRLARLNWMSFVSTLFYPKGIRRRLTLYWIEEMFTDFRHNKDVSLRDKIWAYRHGFLSYRLKQYGITRENHLEYISDLEYLFVRHINNDYKAWLEDKITIKYLCRDYKECFPSYYYYVSMRNGASRIIPLMDCPEGFGTTHQDIIELAKKVGILALKPDKGSWGKGFYRLEYIDGKFYLNFEEASEKEVLELLSDPNTQYLVTEYIQMHPELKRIYSGSVNTIRMIVYKRDGKNATIGNAYMRFGSKATGAVDNMRAGGMFARIDIDTGRYYDAKILQDNMIVDRECHPDTGVKIEGVLPNWEKVKQLVLDIANSFDQLEYFGFDIAITEDGIKLPEINRYPGYPRIETFNRDTIDYLLERLMEKEKRFGYDQKLPHKLIKLQDRTGRKK